MPTYTRQFTAITTTTATAIVDAPATSQLIRAVSWIAVKNEGDDPVSLDVTHHDGTNDWPVAPTITLEPGDVARLDGPFALKSTDTLKATLDATPGGSGVKVTAYLNDRAN